MNDTARGERDAVSAESPPAALGEVWDALDLLDRAQPPIDMAATTVTMVAASVDGPDAIPAGGVRRWALPAVVVAAALVTGIAAGRLTVPDGDRLILENLPLVRHVDLLREAGSVRFLQEFSKRDVPPRPGARIGSAGELRREDRVGFTREVDALRAELAAGDSLAERRAAVQALGLEDRLEFEDAVRTYLRLSATERRALAQMAAALTDPANDTLREAALRWREWLGVAKPEDRADIVARSTDKRLEWIAWYVARLESRAGDRQARDGERRPPGFFRPGDVPPRPAAGPPLRPTRRPPPDRRDERPPAAAPEIEAGPR